MYEFFKKLFTYHQWFIAYRDRKKFNTPFDTGGFQTINSPRGRFYADPFVIKHEGINYIFFEDYCWIKRKGVISFVQIDNKGNLSPAKIALEKEYHLSYPFLFKWNNQIFMIPETSNNNTIELYSTKEFPFNWKIEKNLMMNLNASDTTILFSDEKVWMFTNIIEKGRPGFTDLYLFYADTIFDEWQAHPQNPIVSDIRCARPAGNFFIHNGEIIRPSQNSFVRYGESLVFNKLTCLTKCHYSELRIEQINPTWYPRGLCCHTYNFNEDLEVIDGLTIKKDIREFFIKLAAVFYRKFDKKMQKVGFYFESKST